MFFQKVCQTAHDMLKHSSPARCPLFKEYLSDMLKDANLKDLAGAEDVENQLWERLPQSNPLVRRGGKAVMGRFLEVIARLRDELEDYGQRKVFYVNACLELDIFGNADLVKLLVQPSMMDGTTGSRSNNKQELKLSQACVNQLACAASSMLDPLGQRKDRIIVECTRNWLE